MSLLPSAQGLAVSPNSDDLDVSYAGDLVTIGRARGLTLSPTTSASRVATLAMDAPKPAAMPGLIDPDWSKAGPGGFLTRYDQLLSAVADRIWRTVSERFDLASAAAVPAGATS